MTKITMGSTLELGPKHLEVEMEALVLSSQVRAEIQRLSVRSLVLVYVERDLTQEAEYRLIQARLKVLEGPLPFQGW